MKKLFQKQQNERTGAKLKSASRQQTTAAIGLGLPSAASRKVSKRMDKRKALLTYIFIFLVLVTIWYFFIYPQIQKLKSSYEILFILLWFIGKILFWIFPVLIYLQLVGIKDFGDFLKIKSEWGKGIAWGILLSAFWVILRWILFYVILRHRNVSFNIGFFYWVAGASVGIFEEIPFRGLILQELNKQIKFWLANIITTLIFLIYHIPTWIISGQRFINLLPTCFMVILLSLIWGYIFKKTKSIWSVAIFHSLHDLSIWIGIM